MMLNNFISFLKEKKSTSLILSESGLIPGIC